MSIDFHDPKNTTSYTNRSVDNDWKQLIASRVNLKGIQAADVGCGGGIYSKALIEMGVESVVGVDFSRVMLEGATINAAGHPNLRFQQGNALSTGLDDESVGLVLERALIHHLSSDELVGCMKEANRILKRKGVFIVQDRTPEDCALAGSKEHVRGYIFNKFPRLLAQESSRRHSSDRVLAALRTAGFKQVKEISLWEARKSYDHFTELREDLLQRTGRSILHELTDEELEDLIVYIQQQLAAEGTEALNKPLVEQDRWTLWFARKD
ncbi:class I SAM-dependent methyltransferase [Paenibacillus periandrae]|uniref:class I SAM-dependent methyltransferase n=1 Tax=Paenibacillus periandrae TaxID=1761741 RepID=UPI001F08E244|nr:class I SAM-dependent methyltransferase [Paenibacillus periandrae]